MHRIPTVLLAAFLATVASVVHAEGVATLSSHVCLTPQAEELKGGTPPGASVNEASRLAEERWHQAFTSLLARCQAGDIIVLTHNPVGEALRVCNWDRAVYLRPGSSTIRTYAGGVRDER